MPFVWQTAFCSSGLSAGVTSSKKPSLISPGPGCSLLQHNAPSVYPGNSAVRLLSVTVQEEMGRFYGALERGKTVYYQAYSGCI